jgi:polysaccharide biosynthesis protein PslH
MLSSTFPYPPSRSGTEVRTFNLLKYLQARHSITLVTQWHEGVSEQDVEVLRQYVDELAIFPLREDIQAKGGFTPWLGKGRRFVESMVKGIPPNVLHRYSPQMQAWVDDWVEAGKCDAIACEHSVNTIYIKPSFSSRVRTVVNVHSSVFGGTLSDLQTGASENALRDRLYLSMLYRYEKNYCSKFSSIVVTTEDDRRQLLKLSPHAQIQVIPNGVDLELFPYRPVDPGGHRLIFVGAMDLSHNIDAACFFASEVLPVLQQRYPDVTFSIVGTRPAPTVLALGEIKGVIVTGRVPSVVEQLHAATVCVVPLRTGFGIKNKTLEAMAAGVPVVGSDRGLEGLAVNGEGVPLRALRANQVDEYVEAISRLFDNPDLREELSQNARSLIEQDYTWERAGELYEQALLGHQG